MTSTGTATGKRPGWGGPDILVAALLLGAVYVGLQLLWFAHVIFFLIFLGILLGLALASAVDVLKRWGVPRGLGTAALVLLSLGLLVLVGGLVAPTVRAQAEELRTEFPAALEEFESWIDQRASGLLVLFREEAEPDAPPPDAPEDEAAVDTLRSQLASQLTGAGRHLFSFLSSTVTVIGGILLILFVAIYYAVDPRTYREGFLLMIPRSRRDRVAAVMDESAVMLRRWLVTQLITMALVGALTTVVLGLLGVPAALVLGIFAGILEFIPIFGPIIASIPAIAMAFLVSPQTALYVAGTFILIQQAESQLLVPLLMKEGIDLPPVLTVVIQALMAIVFGFIGLMVAVPLVAVSIVWIKMLYVQDFVGEQVALPSDAAR